MKIGINIILAGIPKSLNRYAGRQNAWEYREQKEYWTNEVCFLGRAVRPSKPFEKAIVTITYTFPDRRRRDPDNYSGKQLIDGLTKAGIIADDSFKHIELRLRAEPEPGEARTVITIQEVQNES